jgi:hypothetical protein
VATPFAHGILPKLNTESKLPVRRGSAPQRNPGYKAIKAATVALGIRRSPAVT